ncbi:YdcH family protein [Roseomonas genomospecies 6]|nr:YdcH family protein [Roseomonas genomospecies 6]
MSLRQRHAALDARIHAEYSHTHPDDLALKRLKLEKLRLKEEIDRLAQH